MALSAPLYHTKRAYLGAAIAIPIWLLASTCAPAASNRKRRLTSSNAALSTPMPPSFHRPSSCHNSTDSTLHVSGLESMSFRFWYFAEMRSRSTTA